MNLICQYIILLIPFFSIGKLGAESHIDKDCLVLMIDTINEEYGYKNLLGDTIIPFGKYPLCFTDTFKTYAIVLMPQKGYFAIDRKEKILYEIFPFDNAPDEPSEGLFRILMNDKIGFADFQTGKIVIKPQFDYALPFVNGKAKVAFDSIKKPDGEHTIWYSKNAFFIDKQGKIVK